ncbi:MAG: 4-hydroxybenzoate octaprenyltransferase [Alphaproteobacteria bacterium]|nr:4-hydroxybenzoate octaprenyltransferase [Alphaproteobacteria bacterium]
MQSQQDGTDRIADAGTGNWVDRFAPEFAKPYARLARWDRPIGFWLLFWPCAMSLGLVAVAQPMVAYDFVSFALFLIGAVAMRGAGCTFNDIVDRDIDSKVARTRERPLASGRVSLVQAIAWLVLQSLVGLVVLVQFNGFTIWLGIASLALVAIYPFMKRITWWPQLFLGLAFSWGALVGWSSEFGALHLPAYLMYFGAILWTIGYDTIYALQDVEDDALIGVRSTARLFGTQARVMVALFYASALALWIWAGMAAEGWTIFLLASIPTALILFWQVVTLDPDDPKNCLVRFKANHYVGLTFTLALWIQAQF